MEEVTLLGERLDNRLVLITIHTNELCKKTGRQVNALKRLCRQVSRREDGRLHSFYLEQFPVLPSNMAPLLIIEHSKNRNKLIIGFAVCHKRL